MRSSPTPGFDLRSAVESLRETFGPLLATSPAADGTPGSARGDERGRDIRAAILIELSDEPMHGYQLIGAIDGRSGGSWKPGPGVVYPTLQLLVDEALVTAEQVGERKVYSLTGAGRLAATEAATAEPSTDKPHQQQQRGHGVHGAVALTKSGVAFGHALTQVAQIGTTDQSARAVAIVDDARRKLYALLAED
jgi:DNA-binding PadR family transcriptional regulator